MKKKIKPFNLVDLSGEITADTDGRPVIRYCHAHELMMSFDDDEGCKQFKKFWKKEGKYLFAEFMRKKEIPEIFITR